MATRSNIGMEIKSENGQSQVVAVYCHFDGYPEGVGKKLLEHYHDREKVKELIALGALSYIEKEVGRLTPTDSTRPHNFEHPIPGVTVAYHRDRGDDFRQLHFSSVQDYFANFESQYAYLFTDEGEWLVSGGVEPVPVAYVLSGIEEV